MLTDMCRLRRGAGTGPCAFDNATARLSMTTGEGCNCSNTRYNSSISAQSVSTAEAARSCNAAMVACT